MRVYRLRVVIPLVLCLFAAVAALFLLVDRLASAQQTALRSGNDELATVALQLQDSVNSSLARGDAAMAQESIAVAALDPVVARILLVDGSDKVLFASESSWRGAAATVIPDYDRAIAQAAVSTGSGRLSPTGGSAALTGYYPVTLQVESGGLEPRKGVLFIEADFTPRLQEARLDAYANAGYLAVFAVLSALTLAVVLHFTVTRGVTRLSRSFAAAASGDLSVRSGLRGNGELAQLGESFDAMTEQLAKERDALQLSESHYHALFDAGNDPTYISDLDGRILEVNDAACRVMGRSREEFLTMSVGHVDAQEESAAAPARTAKVMRDGGAIFETVHATKDGTRIPVEVSSRITNYGDRPAILSVCRDISLRRQAERERTRLLDVLDRSLNEIYMFDPETLRFTYANAGARQNLGYTMTELGEKTAYDVKPTFDEESFRDLLRPLFQRRQDVLAYETFHRRADGSTYPVESHLQLVEDGGGQGIFLAVVTDISERKIAEEALRASERKFRTFADLTSEWEYWTGPDNTFVYMSPSCERVTGYAVKEYLDDRGLLGRVVHPDDRERVGSHFDVVSEHGPISFDYRIVTRGGEVRWIDHRSQPVYGGGTWLGVRASNSDVTERKNAEQAALAASSYARSLIEASLDPLVTISPEGKITDVNAATELVTGVSRDKLIGTDFSGYFTEPAKARASYREVLEHGLVRDYPLAIRNVSGATTDVLYNASLYQDESGATLGVFAAARDITDRKRSEDALREKTELLDRFFALTPDLLVIADTEGHFLEINRSVEGILGFTQEEMLKGGYYEFIHPDDIEATRKVVETMEQEGPLIGFNNRYRCKDGSHRWLEWRAVWAGGLVYAAARDITERRQAEELRIAKEAAEAASVAKGAFLANMSHEIRTPMNAILGFAQLMRQDPTLSSHQREQLDIINSSGEHLLALVNDVLEMSRIEAGRTTVSLGIVDLWTMLNELKLLFTLRADSKGLGLEVQGLDDLPHFVVTDGNKLRQVLVNLIGNAIKFTEHGDVTIRVETRKNGSTPQIKLHVSVEDTGPGIPPEDMDNLFHYFERGAASANAESGTGLGLAISQEFVRSLGGEISVSSQVGRGSVFTFEIPVAETSEASQGVVGRRVVGLAPEQPRYRILIADDAADNRDLLLQMLGPIGFDLRTAADGLAALEEFRSWHPHLILLDMRMPVMDGYEVIRQMRRKPAGRRAKIIVVSASAFSEIRQEVLLAGADDFVSKPVERAELLDKIAACLNVKYLYEEGPVEPEPQTAPDVAAIAALKPELVERLRQAATRADFDEVLEVASEIARHDKPLAAELSAMARQFDADAILSALSADGASASGAAAPSADRLAGPGTGLE